MKALITGINGQDGSYLAELLLSKGYAVHGIIRRSSQDTTKNLLDIIDSITIHYGDLIDAASIYNIIQEVQPNEVYNLGAMTDVRESFDIPVSTFHINTIGFINVLEAVKHIKPDCKIYQAGSSEMFGDVYETPQKETTRFNPQSPYGVSKVACHWMAKLYRKSYGMKIYNGILFNHESFRRGDKFVTKKIVKAAVRIKKGLQDKLVLGNLYAKRDWGYSPEYVEWMWNIMQSDPDDYVICTGETNSVLDFVRTVFDMLDMDHEYYVEYDKNLERPSEVSLLKGDFTKSKEKLGFEPKVKFWDLVNNMVDEELKSYETT